jgi:hypothetical protein
VNARLISWNSTEAEGIFVVHSQTFDKLKETNEQRVVRPGHGFLKNAACASASN